jgi:hypothetical protein
MEGNVFRFFYECKGMTLVSSYNNEIRKSAHLQNITKRVMIYLHYLYLFLHITCGVHTDIWYLYSSVVSLMH